MATIRAGIALGTHQWHDATLTGGDDVTLVVRWWDDASNRYRMATGYVGEGGIEAGKAYRVDSRGMFVAAEDAVAS